MVKRFLELVATLDPERVSVEDILSKWQEAGGRSASLAEIKIQAGKLLGFDEMRSLTTSLQEWVRLARHVDEPNPTEAAQAEEKQSRKKKSTASTAAVFKELKEFRNESEYRHEELVTLYEMLQDRLLKHIDLRFQQLWDAMLAASRGEHVPERPFGRKSGKQE